MPENVFAYGTLRPSLYPHTVKRYGLVPKPGVATLKGSFKLLNLGSFPGIVKTSTDFEDREIKGEVSEVDNLRSLDAYEGYPSLYTRDQFDVILADGSVIRAWVYLFNGAKDTSQFEEISTGDWSKR